MFRYFNIYNMMTKTRILLAVLLLAFSVNCLAQQVENKLPKWAFGGFVRSEDIDPIISPDTASRFFDPVSQKKVAWEANDTFNPAAAMKNGKIVVMYRAEDLYVQALVFAHRA